MRVNFIAYIFISVIFFFVFLNKYDTERKIKKESVNRQKTNLAIDIGKLIYINTILSNKGKNYKYIDSIYEIRKDSILDRVYK